MTERGTRVASGAERPPMRRRLGLAEQVLVGFLLGVAAGVFFGEMVGWLKIVGDIFIKLLQITVIPYVSLSLITGVGGLRYDDIKVLALKGGGVLLGVWAVTLLVVVLMPLSFPEWPSSSFFSTSLVEEAPTPDFLSLFIPSNPFDSYANAVVPAVVVFSILVGIALIGMDKKQAAIEPLSVFRDALMQVTGIIAKLAPLGVFALIASAAGTTDIEDLARLQVYIVLYSMIALVFGLLVLPALVTALTPLRYGDIVSALRTPLITAFATGSSLIVLPLLVEECKRLIADATSFGEKAQEQADTSVDVLIPTSYTFPSASILLSLFFILFGGWYIGSEVSVTAYPTLILVGIPTLFGGTLFGIPFLLDLFRLPNDLFQVFISLDVIGGRFGVILSVMHFAAVALIGAIAVAGRLRLRLVPLIRFALVSTASIAAVLIGVRAFYTYVVVAPYTKDQALKGLHLLINPQPAKVYSEVPEHLKQADREPASLTEIKHRGVLRVCFVPGSYPSAFFNDENPPQLVGFHVEMAHRFARHIEVPIEFLAVDNETDGAERLNAGSCDLLMASLPISAARAVKMALTLPVYRSPVGLIVRDHRRNDFQTWGDLRELGVTLRLALRGSSETLSAARAVLPDATFVPIYSQDDLKNILESGASDVDAIVAFSEEGAAWTLLYPNFTLVVLKPTMFVPMVYATTTGNDGLLRPFNAWIVAQKSRGTFDKMYKYWMLGEAAKIERPPRWSVIRNVLHWID